MKFLDLLHTAFLNLWRRKLRAVLTILGLVIGVSAIVVMVSLGIGIQQATIQGFAGTGSLTTIQVMSTKWVENGESVKGGTSQQTPLDKKALSAIKQIPGVKGVMPLINAYGALKCGKYITDISILGIDLKQAELFDFELSEGRMPKAHKGNQYEIVLANFTLQNFYDPTNWKQAIDKDGNPKVKLDARFQFTFDSSQFYNKGGAVAVYKGGTSIAVPAGGSDGGETTRQPGKLYSITPVGIMGSEGNDYTYYCRMDLEALKKLAKENTD